MIWALIWQKINNKTSSLKQQTSETSKCYDIFSQICGIYINIYIFLISKYLSYIYFLQNILMLFKKLHCIKSYSQCLKLCSFTSFFIIYIIYISFFFLFDLNNRLLFSIDLSYLFSTVIGSWKLFQYSRKKFTTRPWILFV